MHGWLLLDKPEGITSSQAVFVIKKLLKYCNLTKLKVGHAGTLDPLASGLLLVAIGEAVKTVNYAMGGSKSYEFSIKWGEARDTLDREGVVTATSSHVPTREEIISAIEGLRGKIEQRPPQYSAIKVGGYRAYDLARKGVEFLLSPRTVELHDLELMNCTEELAHFRLDCGKGFYVRSLAAEIAHRVGACGHVSYLRRTSIKNFLVQDTILLDKIKDLMHNASHAEIFSNLQQHYLQPIHSVLDDILVQEVAKSEATKLRLGQPIQSTIRALQGAEVAVFSDAQLIAICLCDGCWMRPKRVFNL